MQIARSADLEWAERIGGRAAVGQARTQIKRLHEAGPEDEPGFEMVVARYPAPRDYPVHRHSIDQVRLTLVGASPWRPDQATPEGGVLYIPAGTSYGPYTRPAGIELMQVQFQGLDDVPFAGEAGSQDGPYPAPRVAEPIELDPGATAWVVEAPGVERRDLLVFGSRGVRLGFVRVGGDAGWRLTADCRTLAFVAAGRGRGGGSALEERDAIRLEAGESVDLAGEPSFELFVLCLGRATEAAAGRGAPGA